MATPDISEDLLRLAEALVFASAEPATGNTPAPLPPACLDPYQVFQALQEHCAGRGVILAEHGGGWVFRTAPDLAGRLQSTLTRHRRLPRAAMEVLAVTRDSRQRSVRLGFLPARMASMPNPATAPRRAGGPRTGRRTPGIPPARRSSCAGPAA